jgi:hypothetical protein
LLKGMYFVLVETETETETETENGSSTQKLVKN